MNNLLRAIRTFPAALRQWRREIKSWNKYIKDIHVVYAKAHFPRWRRDPQYGWRWVIGLDIIPPVPAEHIEYDLRSTLPLFRNFSHEIKA